MRHLLAATALLAAACSAAPASPPPKAAPPRAAAPKAAPLKAASPKPAAGVAQRWSLIKVTGAGDATVVIGLDPVGRELFRAPLGHVATAIAAPDGGAYALVESGKTSIVHLDDRGREVWRVDAISGARLLATPDRVLASFGDMVRAYRPADGALLDWVDSPEGGVYREASTYRRMWSVWLRLFPAFVPSRANRKVAVGADGTVLTGASDGSLFGIDPGGKPLFQLGVRGAVSEIVARRDGDFDVFTSAGVAVVGPRGAVRSDMTAYSKTSLAKPGPTAQPDLEGTPAPPPPAAAPSRALAIESIDASYRLERIDLPVEGGLPLRGALGVAEGPGGVLWFHDGHRVVEHDGTRTRLLHQAAPLAPLACQRCLAPAGAGEGALIARDPRGVTDLRGVTAGRVSAELVALPALLGVSRSPSGALWAVSAGGDDGLSHAIVHSARGLRRVAGLPAAAYADVAARADDDVWIAGGLIASRDDVRAWPGGEGTLVRFDGRAFTRYRAPDGALLSVASVGPGEAWAVGTAGGVMHARAGAVEAFHLVREDGKGLPVILRSVAATGPEEVWLSGDNSTLLRWNGKALRRVDASAAGRDAALSAVIAPGAKPGWVVGPTGIWRLMRAGAQ